tara:strand:+ start:975 stop:1124 length:150 start_codon:yes stop_codon:yes gene_type:complete
LKVYGIVHYELVHGVEFCFVFDRKWKIGGWIRPYQPPPDSVLPDEVPGY